MIREVVGFDLLRRSGRSLLASLAPLDNNFQSPIMIRDVVVFDLLRRSGRSLLASLALLNLVLEYSVVCRARRSTQAKSYISRAQVSSLVYSRPQLPINPKSFTLGKHRFLVVPVFWVERLGTSETRNLLGAGAVCSGIVHSGSFFSRTGASGNPGAVQSRLDPKSRQLHLSLFDVLPGNCIY
jgi:hypothetical protein